MRHAFALAVLVLSITTVSAFAEDSIVGKWEGKSKDGKVQIMEFKADHTLVSTEDGRGDMPEGAKWEIIDAVKGYLNVVFKTGGKESRIELLFELKGDSLKIGGSVNGKRAESMSKAADPVKLTRKK